MSIRRFRAINWRITKANSSRLVRFALEQLETRLCLSAFYNYDIIAQTGSGLTSIQPAASINDSGDVAFVASTSVGQSVYVGDGSAAPQIISFASPSSSRTYGQELQINNAGQVAAQDRTSGNPIGSLARIWDSNSPGTFTTIGFGLSPHTTPLSLFADKFDAVGSFVTVSNDGQLAFAGLETANDGLPAIPEDPNDDGWEIHLSDSFVDARDVVSDPIPGFGSEVTTFTTGGPFFRFAAADGDRVVIGSRNSAAGPKQIVFYDITGLDSSVTIASTTSGMWSDLGVRPGISDDGSVVVFYGDLTATGASSLGTVPGPGIFASILEGSGNRQLIRLAGGNGQVGGSGVPSQSPDVGYAPPSGDRNGDSIINNLDVVPIYLQSFDVDSRISVATLQAGGSVSTIDAQDSFVVTFLGTPSQASRNNPQTNVPMLFTDQRGVWSMRVDVDAPLTGSGPDLYNRTSAIPVVQINDMVGGQQVTTLAVHDAVALASPLDNSGSALPVHRGDHAVAFHAGFSGGSLIVRANHVDADQDGLFDHWETTGLDMDRDGSVDFSLSPFGANRLRRDLFLEIDWLSPDKPTANPMTHRDFSPQLAALNDVLSTFSAAPVTNPDGSTGITVHIDAGSGLSRNVGAATLQGGDLISEAGTNNHIHVIYFDAATALTFPGTDTFGRPIVARSMDSIKSAFFGTVDKRARELVFHYVVFGDRHSTYLKTDGTDNTSSGRGEQGRFPGSEHSIPGNDFVVTLQGKRDSAGSTLNIPPSGTTSVPRPVGFSQSQTLIHELGHTLGLRHGGSDDETVGPWVTTPAELAILAAKANYRSLMNYAYQLSPDMSGNLVRSYSVGTPFNDWANIKLNFTDYFLVGNTFGLRRQLGDNTPEGQDEEQTVEEFEAIHGPLDSQLPAVTIDPMTPTQLSIGGSLPVTVVANDMFGIASVQVQFDVNGDGLINPPTEERQATLTGPNTYMATFSGVSGPVGSRTLSVVAIDGSDFVSTTTSVIQVQASSNQPPVAAADSASTPLNSAATIGVLANDTDADGTINPTTVVVGTSPTSGSVGVNPTTGVITYTPNIGFIGTDTFTYTVKDDQGAESNAATVTVNVVANQAPTISDIADQSTPEDVALVGQTFTIGDLETAVASLTVSAMSSDLTLFPLGSITFGGTGANRTINLAPAANLSGSATITVTVNDGNGGSAVDTFVMTVNAVNDDPTISDILTQSTNEDTPLNNVPLTIGDIETASTALQVTASSSDATLFPAGSITFGGSAANRTISLSPAANASGTATITVTVTDANGGTISDTFTINVTAVNDAPTLSTIANPPPLPVNSVAQTIALAGITAGGGESQNLTVTATSNNPGLIPNPSVNYTSPGSAGSLSFTPVANQSGTAIITVTVTDNGGTLNGGANSFTRTFTVIVEASTTAPGTAQIVPDPLNPSQGMLVVNGTSGPDLISVLRSGANRTLVSLPLIRLSKTFENTAFTRVLINGLTGNDRVILDPLLAKPATIHGDAGDDILQGGAAADIIHGGAGADHIYGRSGNDYLYGDAGRDRIYGETGDNVLLGGTDNDLLYGGAGRDILNGGDGFDVLYGLGGDDVLIGGNLTHSANDAALQAIQAAWISNQAFANRISSLATAINSSTVSNDGKSDWIYGGLGRDWIVDYALLDLVLDFGFAANGDKRN